MTNRFDDVAGNWDTPERIERAKKIAEVLTEKYKISSNMDLFEFGTGTGILSLMLSQYAKHITASDNSEGMLKVLKEKIDENGITNIKPLKLDIEKDLAFTEKYDIVFSTMVLHHIEDTASVAEKLYTITNEGGKIAIIDLMKEAGDFHNDNTGIKHYGFTNEELLEAFSKAGFRNISVNTLYTIKKNVKTGEIKEFPVFLMYGEK